MELAVKRVTRTPNSTTGDFYINGVKTYHTLEDPDRGLHSDMTLAQIQAIKIHGNTAIPEGRYQVTKYFSPKHNAWVPLLLHVPGFEGVEIHAGNTNIDTAGCLLLGMGLAPDMVTNSKEAIGAFYPLFFDTIAKGEQVWITYN